MVRLKPSQGKQPRQNQQGNKAMNTKDILSSEVKTDIGNLVHRIIQVHGLYLQAADANRLSRAHKWSKHMDQLQGELNDRYGIKVQ